MSDSLQSKVATSKRADIEGLRALSIVLVFAYHLFPAAVPGGFIGVDVFFVISGFLITQHLFGEYASTGRLRPIAFYGRRIRRLLPASFLVLLVSLAVTAFVLPASNTERFAGGIAASALYVANWFLALTSTGYSQMGSDPSIIQQYWSLSVEEQFYLIWPLLFILVAAVVALLIKKRANPRGIFIGVLEVVFVASLATSVLQTRSMPEEAFFSTFTRAWEFALGGLVAFVPAAHKFASTPTRKAMLITLSWVALAAILAATWLLNDTMPFPGWRALVPVGAAAILIAIGDLRTTSEPAYLSKFVPILAIGGLSYSIYLWHWPVIIVTAQFLGDTVGALQALFIIAITLILAIATKYLVENPLRFGPALRTPKRAILFAAIGGLTIVGLAFGANARAQDGIAQARAEEAPFQSVAQIHDSITQQLSENQWRGITQFTPRSGSSIAEKFGCFAVHDQESIDRCYFGPKDGSRLMLVVGDSFADMFTAGIVAGFANTDWRILPLNVSQCPVADVTIANRIRAELNLDCTQYQKWRIDQIQALKPDLIVVAHNTTGYRRLLNAESPNDSIDTTWVPALVSALSNLKKITPSIVVLGEGALSSNCDVDQNPTTCLTTTSLKKSFADLEQTPVKRLGITYVDTRPWFCDTSLSICPEAIDGTYVHRALNDSHISDEYSKRLANLLRESITAGIVQ